MVWDLISSPFQFEFCWIRGLRFVLAVNLAEPQSNLTHCSIKVISFGSERLIVSSNFVGC